MATSQDNLSLEDKLKAAQLVIDGWAHEKSSYFGETYAQQAKKWLAENLLDGELPPTGFQIVFLRKQIRAILDANLARYNSWWWPRRAASTVWKWIFGEDRALSARQQYLDYLIHCFPVKIFFNVKTTLEGRMEEAATIIKSDYKNLPKAWRQSFRTLQNEIAKAVALEGYLYTCGYLGLDWKKLPTKKELIKKAKEQQIKLKTAFAMPKVLLAHSKEVQKPFATIIQRAVTLINAGYNRLVAFLNFSKKIPFLGDRKSLERDMASSPRLAAAYQQGIEAREQQEHLASSLQSIPLPTVSESTMPYLEEKRSPEEERNALVKVSYDQPKKAFAVSQKKLDAYIVNCAYLGLDPFKQVISLEDVKKAYKTLSEQTHSDKCKTFLIKCKESKLLNLPDVEIPTDLNQIPKLEKLKERQDAFFKLVTPKFQELRELLTELSPRQKLKEDKLSRAMWDLHDIRRDLMLGKVFDAVSDVYMALQYERMDKQQERIDKLYDRIGKEQEKIAADTKQLLQQLNQYVDLVQRLDQQKISFLIKRKQLADAAGVKPPPLSQEFLAGLLKPSATQSVPPKDDGVTPVHYQIGENAEPVLQDDETNPGVDQSPKFKVG